jgi:peptidyl-prolyl cis-trans isomerase A (cyclophilin A)
MTDKAKSRRDFMRDAITVAALTSVAGMPGAKGMSRRILPRVSIGTSRGRMVAVLFTDKAPITAGNFLRYVDAGLYKNSFFYRAVRPDNDERSPKIHVIQGGIDPTCKQAPLPPIAHESTQVTGLRHVNGALSSVRWDPSNGNSEFFIVIGDTPSLDFGGARMPDGLGCAVFGAIVEGMDVVHRINASRTTASTIEFMKDQALTPPVPTLIERLPE